MQRLAPLIVLFVLLNCSKALAITYPAWVLNPPTDTQQWFYSAGAGDSLELAQKNALGDLASRLILTVQSSTRSVVDKTDNQSSSFFTTDTLLTSKQFEFSQLNMVQSEQIDQRIYVLLKVDRPSFFKAVNDSLIEQIEQYKDNEALPLAQRVKQRIRYSWFLPSIASELRMLESYQETQPALSFLLKAFEQPLTHNRASLAYQVVSPSLTQAAMTKLEQPLTKMGLTHNNSNPQLVVIVAGANIQAGSSQYHNAVKATQVISYVYDGFVIWQHVLEGQAAAESSIEAQKQAEQQLSAAIGAL